MLFVLHANTVTTVPTASLRYDILAILGKYKNSPDCLLDIDHDWRQRSRDIAAGHNGHSPDLGQGLTEWQ